MLRAVLLATALVVASLSGAAVAQSQEEKSFVDAVIDDENDDITARIARTIAETTGSWARNYASIAASLDEPDGNASTYATDLRKEFNDESEAIQAEANGRVGGDTSRDVFRVCTHDRDGGAATVYVVSNVTDGEYTDTRMVEPSTFSSLNRSVDYNVSLDWYASTNAAAEVDKFGDKAAGEEPVAKSYQVRMVAQYGDSVQSGLWGAAPENCPA